MNSTSIEILNPQVGQITCSNLNYANVYILRAPNDATTCLTSCEYPVWGTIEVREQTLNYVSRTRNTGLVPQSISTKTNNVKTVFPRFEIRRSPIIFVRTKTTKY